MVIAENNPEDIEDHPLDHAPDALRYGLMSRPQPTKPLPKEPDLSPEARLQRHMQKQMNKKKRVRME
jgi:hypothetical protein